MRERETELTQYTLIAIQSFNVYLRSIIESLITQCSFLTTDLSQWQ